MRVPETQEKPWISQFGTNGFALACEDQFSLGDPDAMLARKAGCIPWHTRLFECVPTGDTFTLVTKDRVHQFDTRIEGPAGLSTGHRGYIASFECRGGLLYFNYSTGDHSYLVIEPLASAGNGERLIIAGHKAALRQDGRLVVFGEQDGFSVWSIDFPNAQKVVSCRLKYDAESDQVLLAEEIRGVNPEVSQSTAVPEER
ncbi:MAG TPA: hypothetical protein HPP77_06510 [Candidatus Hydrogenedentes bacterium]|nr:hypothetical protein [Candidatus Hydrogenedentota bacterium]